MARLARELSQDALAQKAKITQGYLSKIEHGLSEPDEATVEALSKVLGFPVTFFYQSDQVLGLPVSVHPMFRKRASVGKRALDALQAQLNVRLLHLRRLLSSVELKQQLELPALDVDEHGGNPERIAELVRRMWLVPNGPVQNLTALVEKAGCIVVSCELPELSVDGITVRAIDLPPCIFLNAGLPGDRQRFTLAHELGHLVMHRTPTPSMEEEAHAFASAFLMDRHGLSDSVRGARVTLPLLAQLKPIWKVSMQALLMRLQFVGSVQPSQSSYLWRRISALGYRTHEPDDLSFAPERPSVMPRLIEVHLGVLGYSIAELGTALHVFEEELTTMYGLKVAQSSRRLTVVK